MSSDNKGKQNMLPNTKVAKVRQWQAVCWLLFTVGLLGNRFAFGATPDASAATGRWDWLTADSFNKVILGIVALISLVVAPCVQWKIAKQQAKLQEETAKRQANLQSEIAHRQAADNVSSKRQNWIDELRKEVSEYLTLFGLLEDLRRPAAGLALEGQKKNFEQMVQANLRATELGIRIKLRLNPNEAEHNELVQLLWSLAAACADPPPGETDEQREAARSQFRAIRGRIIVHVQSILKREWERVKAGQL